jgi:hypothetical protein
VCVIGCVSQPYLQLSLRAKLNWDAAQPDRVEGLLRAPLTAILRWKGQ